MWRLFAILLFPAAPVAAMEWLGATELESSCDAFLAGSTDDDAALCLAYMQGILAGADAAPSGIASAPGDESYADRAARTRLGTLRLSQIGPDRPDYCLDGAHSAVQIVEAVGGYLETHEEARRLTNAAAVLEALAHEYPCAQ